MIVVKELRQTCESCPSQWEGTTSDDRQIYVRYRWGWLTISVSEPGAKEEHAAVNGEEVFCERLGHEFDGHLEFSDLKEKTEDQIEWPSTT